MSGLREAPGDNRSRGARPHDDKVILRATQWWGLKELGHVEVVVVGGHNELRESAHCHGQCNNREFGLQHICAQIRDDCTHALNDNWYFMKYK